MYCAGDPVNHADSSGHINFWFARRNKSNGIIIRAHVDATQIHQPFSRAPVPPNFGGPSTYDQAKIMQQAAITDHSNAFAKRAREKSKAISIHHPIYNSQPPQYTPRPYANQMTLDVTLSHRDTTSPLSHIEYEAQLNSISKAAFGAGIDADGLPLPGRDTDTMFTQDPYFHTLNLDTLALDFRRGNTFYFEKLMSSVRSN